MKTQEEYALEIDEIVRRDVESRQSDWFKIDKEIFMQPENKNKAFILGTRKTGCDLIILGGTNCDEGSMDWLFGSLGNENFYERESEELIAELEKMCGKKWVNPYKPEEERFVLTLTDEERSLIEERIKAGYYSSENIEKHMEEAHKAKMAAKRAEICERYDKKIRQAEAEKKIMLCVFDYGLSTDNIIYYPHTNTLSFNWNGYGEKITQEEFDDFVNKVDRSKLPEDIRFELK